MMKHLKQILMIAIVIAAAGALYLGINHIMNKQNVKIQTMAYNPQTGEYTSINNNVGPTGFTGIN